MRGSAGASAQCRVRSRVFRPAAPAARGARAAPGARGRIPRAPGPAAGGAAHARRRRLPARAGRAVRARVAARRRPRRRRRRRRWRWRLLDAGLRVGRALERGRGRRCYAACRACGPQPAGGAPACVGRLRRFGCSSAGLGFPGLGAVSACSGEPPRLPALLWPGWSMRRLAFRQRRRGSPHRLLFEMHQCCVRSFPGALPSGCQPPVLSKACPPRTVPGAGGVVARPMCCMRHNAMRLRIRALYDYTGGSHEMCCTYYTRPQT